MKKVLFATENESKANRFRNALLKNEIEIITIKDIVATTMIRKKKTSIPKKMLYSAYNKLNVKLKDSGLILYSDKYLY